MMQKKTFPPSLSFWELSRYFREVDLLVVGSGIVGLTTALFFKEQNPRSKVLIVEKGMLPSGASTKNAGFACFGSVSEILADLKQMEHEKVFLTIEARIKGLEELRSFVGDHNLKFDSCGGYEVFKNGDASYEECLEFLATLNAEFKDRFKQHDAYSSADELIAQFGFNGVSHMFRNSLEGSIDTGAMMGKLIQLAYERDIAILNGMELIDFEDAGETVTVQFSSGLELNCGHLHVATNGFAAKLLPQYEVLPARAQVLITDPIKNLKVHGTFHMSEGYYYFRNVGDRILFGGGRQHDKIGETTTELELTKLIQDDLEEIMTSIILPDTPFSIDHRWAGIMGVGSSKEPIIQRVSDHVSCAIRLGGMGVAIGTSIGKHSALMI